MANSPSRLGVELGPWLAYTRPRETVPAGMAGLMDLAELNRGASAMVAPGRGVLAADESAATVKKRFEVIGVECTEENRRDYRELLFRSKGMANISGVILFDETIRQKAKDGTPRGKIIEQRR